MIDGEARVGLQQVGYTEQPEIPLSEVHNHLAAG
jgi:hypothetical protein